MQTARREELAVNGKAPPDIRALKPDWGKPTVRNFRGSGGNVGIIRSPVRATALPGGELSVAMVDLNTHAAGNGGQSQGKPKAQGVLLYSENPCAKGDNRSSVALGDHELISFQCPL